MIPTIEMLPESKKIQISVLTEEKTYYLTKFKSDIDNWEKIIYKCFNGKNITQEYILGPNYFSNTIFLYKNKVRSGKLTIIKNDKTAWSYRINSYAIWTNGNYFKQEISGKDGSIIRRTVTLFEGKQLCRIEKIIDNKVVYNRFYPNGHYIKWLKVTDNKISFKFDKDKFEFVEADDQFGIPTCNAEIKGLNPISAGDNRSKHRGLIVI